LDENVRPDVRARPRLPTDAVLHADAVKTAFARTHHVRAGAGPRGRGPVTARPRGHRGGNLGETLSFLYKGGSSNIFPPLPTKPG
jgi:hypothetical protein